MTNKDETDHLLSHRSNPLELSEVVTDIQQRITAAGDLEHVSVAQQLDLLDQLTQFDLGRFLLINKGLNGYWTDYILTHPWYGRKTGKNNSGDPFSKVETFLLDQAPSLLATQQRFEIFLRENQKMVVNNAVLACIPCGLMGELLHLNFDAVDTISLLGIDFDSETLKEAESLAAKRQLTDWATFMQKDAWSLDVMNTYDLISSNGLNIYEPDNDKVTELYREFHMALKPGGKLVTSFLTPPPSDIDSGDWLMDKIDQSNLLLQKTLFVDILGVKWQCFRSSFQTQAQLESVGFKDIQFIYDQAHMFPTVTAIKGSV